MNHTFISFSLKPLKEAGRTFEDAILPELEKIAAAAPENTLHHGFLSREVLEEKGWPTNVVDALDRLWPKQVRYSDAYGHVDRKFMSEEAKRLGVLKVFAIGPLVEGVADEVAAYESQGITVGELAWTPQ